jgi:hypothetical protein
MIDVWIATREIKRTRPMTKINLGYHPLRIHQKVGGVDNETAGLGPEYRIYINCQNGILVIFKIKQT